MAQYPQNTRHYKTLAYFAREIAAALEGADPAQITATIAPLSITVQTAVGDRLDTTIAVAHKCGGRAEIEIWAFCSYIVIGSFGDLPGPLRDVATAAATAAGEALEVRRVDGHTWRDTGMLATVPAPNARDRGAA